MPNIGDKFFISEDWESFHWLLENGVDTKIAFKFIRLNAYDSNLYVLKLKSKSKLGSIHVHKKFLISPTDMIRQRLGVI